MHQQSSRFPHKRRRPVVVTLGKFALLGLLAGVQAGCSGDASVEYAEVMGSIRLGDRPVTSGLIEFVPRSDLGTHGPRFLAAIDAEGHFSVRGAIDGAGTAPGHYKVTVSTLPEVETGSSPLVPLAVKQRREAAQATESAEIPKQFAREETSTITVEVHSGTNELDLDLSTYATLTDRRQAAR